MTRMTTTVALVLALAVPAAGRAQESMDARIPPPEIDVQRLVGGAVLGSAGGMFMGVIVGYKIETTFGYCSDHFCEYGGLGGALLGGLLGSTVLTPLLAHTMGGGQGDVGTGILMTAVATVGGLASISVLGGEGFLVIPVGQVLAAVTTERVTDRRRRR